MKPPEGRGTALSALVCATAVLLLAAACSSDQTTGDVGPRADRIQLDGIDIAVGSKTDTEQLLLGYMAVELLDAAGAEVIDQVDLGDTGRLRDALLAGEIDLYWEYTGTGWLVHLGESDPPADPEDLYRAVADRDLDENGVQWLEPTGADTNFGLAVARLTAEELGLETVEDLANYLDTDPEGATLCVDADFESRPDGLDLFERSVGIRWPRESLEITDTNVIYPSVAAGNCLVGQVVATDGRLPALDLVVLDDGDTFVAYNASVNIREELVSDHPEIVELFADVSGALDDEVMRELNRMVDIDLNDPREVALAWLRSMGFLS